MLLNYSTVYIYIYIITKKNYFEFTFYNNFEFLLKKIKVQWRPDPKTNTAQSHSTAPERRLAHEHKWILSLFLLFKFTRWCFLWYEQFSTFFINFFNKFINTLNTCSYFYIKFLNMIHVLLLHFYIINMKILIFSNTC